MTSRTVTLKDDRMQATMASRAQPSFIDAIRLEYPKTSKRLMTRVIFALMGGGMAALFGLFYVIGVVLGVDETATVEDFLMPGVIQDAFANIAFVGPILIIVLSAGIAGSEYSWGTVRTLTATGVARGKLLAAKLVVVLAASVLLVLIGLAGISITSMGISLVEGRGLSLGWLDASAFKDVVLMIARSSFILAFYGVLGFVVAQVGRSLAAGIAIGLGILMVEPILAFVVGSMGRFGEYADDFTLSMNTEVISSLNTFGTPEEVAGAPEPWQAACLLTLYALLGIGVAVALFRRRDIMVD